VSSTSDVSHALLPAFDEARSASATIKGYLFQFDATLLAALDAARSTPIRVEGVEDFDEATDDWTRCVQCKYYEGTELSSSVLRDVILPMLRRLKAEQTEGRGRWRFTLYGHFKGGKPVPKTLTADEIFAALKTYKVQPDKSHLPIDYAVTEGFDEALVIAFASSFSIVETPPFDKHRTSVISRLGQALGTTPEVTREIHHPATLAYIAQLAASSEASERVTTRDELLRAASPTSPALHALLLRAFGQHKYCKTLRQRYFTHLNLEPVHYLFAIAHRPGEDEENLLGVVATIAAKYGKPKSKRLPSNERRIPIVLLVNMPQPIVSALKSRLHSMDVHFNDGFPYQGASFDSRALIGTATALGDAQLAIVDCSDHLNAVIMRGAPVSSLYVFSSPDGTKVAVSTNVVDIPIGSFNWISQII